VTTMTRASAQYFRANVGPAGRDEAAHQPCQKSIEPAGRPRAVTRRKGLMARLETSQT